MKVYLQGANGEEIELQVNEPDPADGTYVVPISEISVPVNTRFIPGYWWIRIVPDEEE